MDSNCYKISPIISAFVFLLFFTSFACSVKSVNLNNTFRPRNKSEMSNYIKAILEKINKPAVKTIQSDGDLIDCVLSHLQPTFDHPLLKGQKPLTDPPEMPKGHNTSNTNMFEEIFQVWSMSGESCPENTIPIKRTTEQDVLKAISDQKFEEKKFKEHALGSARGEFLGAQATVNVWLPRIDSESEYSSSQMWIMMNGTFKDGTLNSIVVGYKVGYRETYPRLFIRWTIDAFNITGCFNLDCPGFVQTNNQIALGVGMRPVSSYKGSQQEITFSVWKDKKNGNWWVQVSHFILGYWPSSLFPLLKDHASVVQFGGEVTLREGTLGHSTTRMGSGHLPGEGYKKAAFIRNIQVVDLENNLHSAPTLAGFHERPECYNVTITPKLDKLWGNYLFYGGPLYSKCV